MTRLQKDVFENLGFSRHAACAITGVSFSTLNGWIQQGLIRHRQQGTGRHIIFTIADLFRLETVNRLVSGGILPKHIIPNIEDFADTYGEFIRGKEYYDLARTRDGRWTAPVNDDWSVKFTVSLLPLAERVIRGAINAIRANDTENAEEIISHYLSRVRAVWPDFRIADPNGFDEYTAAHVIYYGQQERARDAGSKERDPGWMDPPVSYSDGTP